MDYVSYSKKAFLDLKETYKEQGFALYQPKDDENIVMYATRDGVVHVWRNDVVNQVVTISCVTLLNPADICCGIFEELEKIAKRKHWRGGVHKLHHYLRHIGEEQLDQEGIDPFFYAWMVQYDVQLNAFNPQLSERDYFDCFDDILDEQGYFEIAKLANTIGKDEYELASEYVENGALHYQGIEDFVNVKKAQTTRYQKVRALVNEELPNATDEVRETVTKGILEIFESGERLSRH